MTTAGLVQACQQPTYTTRDGAQNYLDLLLTYDVTHIDSVDGTEGLHGSDHKAVEVRYAFSLPRTGHYARTLQRFDQLDSSHLAQLAHLAPWCMTTTGSDWSSNYELWCDFLFAIEKVCMPTSACSSRRKRSPWITSDIIKAARLKRVLFRRALRSQCPAALQLAKEHQRALKTAIYCAHKKYVCNIAKKTRTDPKIFWAYISRLRKSSQQPCFKVNKTHSRLAPRCDRNVCGPLLSHKWFSLGSRHPLPTPSDQLLTPVPATELATATAHAPLNQSELATVTFTTEALKTALSKITNS